MDLDYYEYIVTYNTEKEQDLINKYFNRIRKTETEFNNLISEAYKNVSSVFNNFYDLQIIMYLYYMSYMVELYMNQLKFADKDELNCLLKNIKFDKKSDVTEMAKLLPPLITKYTENITKTINMRKIYSKESLYKIIQHIRNLVKTYTKKCLNN